MHLNPEQPTNFHDFQKIHKEAGGAARISDAELELLISREALPGASVVNRVALMKDEHNPTTARRNNPWNVRYCELGHHAAGSSPGERSAARHRRFPP